MEILRAKNRPYYKSTYSYVFNEVFAMNHETAKQYDELMQSRADLEKRFSELRQTVIAECRESVAKFNITAAELGLSQTAASALHAGRKTAAKYKNPNGSEVWSGRGSKPRWFIDAIEAGVSEQQMLINRAA